MNRHLRALIPLLLTAALVAGCGSSGDDTGSGPTDGAAVISGTITVFAAASLKGTFDELETRFTAAHPEVKIVPSYGASSDLATAINAGAPADVFAAASIKTMTSVVDAGHAVGPQSFATNTMEIATPPDNPKQVTGLAGLAAPGVKVAVCQAKVPCGDAATAVFEKAGVSVKPVTFEKDVKATLTKVTAGEVDAGIVYVTDVKAAGEQVHGVVIPAEQNYTTTYPIAALEASKNVAAAKAFVAYVVSVVGEQVLAAAGFGRP